MRLTRSESQPRILLVDDDPSLLTVFTQAIRLGLPGADVQSVMSAEEALVRLPCEEEFGVIVSDLRMPGMDGLAFLAAARELTPRSVRLLLTGNADLQAAIHAINVGYVFRFLTKPIEAKDFTHAVELALTQYAMVKAEQRLLEDTLAGSLKVLCDLLALVNPIALGRSARVTRYAMEIAHRVHLKDTWSLRTAAMLSQIGCIILPEAVLEKLYHRQSLTAEEWELYRQHPLLTGDLLRNIPRMEDVATIIAYQQKQYDGFGGPPDQRHGEAIPLGARILKLALDFDAATAAGTPFSEALTELAGRDGYYDPSLLEALREVYVGSMPVAVESLVSELRPNMVLAEDIQNTKGLLVLAQGQDLSTSILIRLRQLVSQGAIPDRVQVYQPSSGGSAASVHEDGLFRRDGLGVPSSE